MKTSIQKLIIGTSLAILLSACTSVGVRTSMGDPENLFTPEQLDGGWLIHADEDEKASYDVMHQRDGSIRMATLLWDSEEKTFKAEEYEGRFLQIGKEPYLQVRSTSPDSLYYFYRISSKEEGKVILRPPSLTPFVQAVETGDLAGTVKRSKGGDATSVVLENGLELRAYLEAKARLSLFAGGKDDVTAERINR